MTVHFLKLIGWILTSSRREEFNELPWNKLSDLRTEL